MTAMQVAVASQGCVNGHDPDQIMTNESGARVCVKCRNNYFYKNRTHSKTRKVNNTHEHRN
jgi:hypothetical protein